MVTGLPFPPCTPVRARTVLTGNPSPPVTMLRSRWDGAGWLWAPAGRLVRPGASGHDLPSIRYTVPPGLKSGLAGSYVVATGFAESDALAVTR